MPDDPAQLQGFASIPRSILHDPTVHRDAKLVYLMLSSHAGGNRGSWPSHRRIADLLGTSVSNVKVRLKWLRDNGYVTWSCRATNDGAQLTNHYVILVGSAPVPAETGSSGAATPSRGEATPSFSTARGVAVEKLGGSRGEATNKSQLNEVTTSSSAQPPTSNAQDLCNRLADRIEANGSKRPVITKAWLEAARLLMEKDGRTFDQIARCIEWCQADEFWRANVLSMPKLRVKYDQLRLAAQRRPPKGASGKPAEAARRNVPEGWI